MGYLKESNRPPAGAFPVGNPARLRSVHLGFLMPLGMVKIKIKRLVVAEPLSTLLNRIVILNPGVACKWSLAGKPYTLLD
jgi:hypothetical protein